VAFRLLVERHQPMARARAGRLSANPSDVDDIVQESFLQAFVALDRLRDPDRFAGWLAGIVLNVGRRLQRRAPVTLLPDWPEHASDSHWQDYSSAAEDGVAALIDRAQPAGFAFLGQEVYADDYRDTLVTYRGEFRTEDVAGRAGLFLRVSRDPRGVRGPLTERAASDDPDNNIVAGPGDPTWTSHEVTARIPRTPIP
jgi:hypothetical protein